MKLQKLSLNKNHKNVVNIVSTRLYGTSQKMNTLLVLLLICAFQYMKCDEELDSKVIMRTSPKKMQTPMQKTIKIINARKFNKLRKHDNRKINYKKKEKKNGYTAFPPIADKGMDTAENLYFQGLHVVDRKPRVKKVLPEYGLNVFRNKRAAGITINQTINEGTIDSRRNIKNQNVVSKTPKHPTKNVEKGDKDLTQMTKGIAKHIKGEVNYVYRKHKSKTTKTHHLRHGNKSTVRLRYTEHVRNKTKSKINKKYNLRTKKKNKGPKIIKRQDEKKVKNRRLIAGRDGCMEEYPYVVSIQKSGQHWCTGSLLNQRLVVTTANCIWKSYRVSKLTVRAGSRYIDRGGQVAKIMEVLKHPSWSIRSSPDNDLGILLLDRNIKFSHTVHEVDLPNRAMWPAFEDVWVTSWGSNRRDGVYNSLTGALQVYHAMLLDHNKCNNVTMRFGVPVSQNFICVAQTGRRAPCTRDTGAPAVSDGILWGVASWGIRKLCGTERFPAMFSYLGSKSNLDFITNATHQFMSDKRFYPYPDRFDMNNPITKPTTA